MWNFQLPEEYLRYDTETDPYHIRMMNGDGFQRDYYLRRRYDYRKANVLRFYTFMACVSRMGQHFPCELRMHMFAFLLVTPQRPYSGLQLEWNSLESDDDDG